MKRLFISALVVVVTIAMAATAFAVPVGKTVEFDGKGAGKVVFDGKSHAESGNKCGDCHKSGLFKMKKGAATITMKEMDEGKFCGGCHNGTKAFSSKDAEKCSKCHVKKIEGQKEQKVTGSIIHYDNEKNSVTIRKKDGTKVTVVMENAKLPKTIAKGKTGIVIYRTEESTNIGTKLIVRGGC